MNTLKNSLQGVDSLLAMPQREAKPLESVCMHWIYLMMAIATEIFATSALKSSDGFTRLVPSIAVILGYSISFYCLSLALRTIPVGIAYALWSGIGVVFVAAIGWLAYNQKLDFPAIAGLALIMAGVLVINLFSKSVGH